MSVLGFILFGLLAGALAKFIMPGNQNMGWIMTIILGILGSIVGGLIGVYILHWGSVDSFWSPKSWILSVGGALIILWLYGMLTKSRS